MTIDDTTTSLDLDLHPGLPSLTADTRAEGRQTEDDPLVEPSPPVQVQRKPAWQTRKLGYQPALDGLRAVAVALVIAYHLGYSGVAGGYIGVEVFFVLSGWLVCALLMNEQQRTGGARRRSGRSRTTSTGG